MRKICLLLLFTIVSAMAIHAETPVYVGDINGDGEVDSSDVSALLEIVLSGGASYKADINGDGSVDSSDVSALLEIVLSGGARKIGESYEVNGVEFSMIDVPAGTFTMGGTEEQGGDAQSNESPTHEVTLSPYMIGQTEVTQELWTAVMGSNPSYRSGDNLPVEQVSWDDCREFIAKLNELTGKSFRLPTEAEWEYAARGGQSAGTKYAGSDDLGEAAWYRGNASYKTHPVAAKRPNALSLYDMSGNVWEWCQDRYGDYDAASQANPQGAASGFDRIYRGGCWYSSPEACRVSRRGYNTESLVDSELGFRLALDYGTVYTVNGVRFSMIDVPGGTFTMGATVEQGGSGYGNETPIHSVTLSGYMIGQTEVTQELWEAVMGSNPSSFSGCNLPVEKVSWDDCQTFISKLNELTGLAFRLPTEAEWEYAARGAQSGGTKYAGSDNVADVAWYMNNSSEKTHPVATKEPNALGIYDMSGNVLEWCQDLYGNYGSEAQTNPQGPTSGSYRVYRGGSWGKIADNCRVSKRSYSSSGYSPDDLGLRIVLDYVTP